MLPNKFQTHILSQAGELMMIPLELWVKKSPNKNTNPKQNWGQWLHLRSEASHSNWLKIRPPTSSVNIWSPVAVEQSWLVVEPLED